MATTSDYFAASAVYCGPSVADITAQDRIDELSHAFDRFLREIGCRRTHNSEWYYGSPHSGIHATYNVDDILYFDPCEVDEEFAQIYCDEDFIRVWNASCKRLSAIHEWLDRHEYHLQDAPYELVNPSIGYAYVRRRDRRDERRWDVMYAAYEEAVDTALEELCDEYEKLLEAECDYAYSEEAAEEWAELQEDVYV